MRPACAIGCFRRRSRQAGPPTPPPYNGRPSQLVRNKIEVVPDNYRQVVSLPVQLYRRALTTRDPSSIAFVRDTAFALCHAVYDAAWHSRPTPCCRPRGCISGYVGGHPLDSLLLGPCLGPLDGLPRLTVFTGPHDVLNPDARAFRRRATAEGLEIGWYHSTEARTRECSFPDRRPPRH